MTSGSFGGKVAGLVTAERCGLQVPPWTAIPAELFTSWADRADVFAAMDGTVDLGRDEQAQQRVLARAENCPLARGEVEAVQTAYRDLGTERVAVRSSGIDEDGERHSYAGVHVTALNVSNAADVATAVRDCWVSAFAPRALSYRAHRTGEARETGMAVILQAMVESSRSGVLFTRDPSVGGTHRAVLSSLYGLGEGLVSGMVDADTIYLDRATGDVRETHVGLKEEAVVFQPAGSGVGLDPVAATRRDSLALTYDEIREIWRAGAALEAYTGHPQDVEWAYDADGKLWILQTRPITTLAEEGQSTAVTQDGEPRLWDNSNIIENFGAVTTPLTFSYAQNAYHIVYREYARLLGVPVRELDRMDPWLRNMLGWFDGHVYYNLLNWYKIIRLLPFYRTSSRVLELQMGLGEQIDDELALAQRPLTSSGAVRGAALRLWIAGRFVLHFLTMHRSATAFVGHFEKQFRQFEDELGALETMDAAAVLDLHQHLEEDLLPRFGRMILLEATIAMSYGAFQSLVNRWLPELPGWATWDAVRPRRQMASATAVDTLERIAGHVRGRGPEVGAVLQKPEGDHYEALRALGEHDLLRMVDGFIATYGYRSANELKFEAPDMRDDPEIFFDLLRGTLDGQEQPEQGESTRAAGSGAETRGRKGGELGYRLRGARGWLLEQARRKTQVSLEDREDVRFCRSRAFGMFRRMANAMAKDLVRIGALEDPSDILYLETGELEKYIRGSATASELAPLVALRRSKFDGFPATPGRARFTTHGVPYWGQNDEGRPRSVTTENVAPREDGEFRGIGCVPGVAVGKVSVLTEPRDVEGGILVTYRTDPGWITVLPTARGLVIERGSPLTHVAIAAREFGIPTVVQVPGITAAIANGVQAKVDGERGMVTTKVDKA